MTKLDLTVGEVDSINGNIISIRLLDNIKSHMPIIDGVVYRVGQIGSFLKIPLGYANLFGVVTQIGSSAIPEALREAYATDYLSAKNTQWVSVALIGEQVGAKFERGVTQYPSANDAVHLVTIKDLDLIYGGLDKADSIEIGNISASESLDARLDLNKLISRHSAIVGSTGSGKSNAVSVFLNAIAEKNYPSARVLVIDPHGEYSEAVKNQSTVFSINNSSKPESLLIPYWALPFDELLSIFSGNLNDQQKDYIREKLVELKLEAAQANNLNVEDEVITADSPIPFSIKKLWFELDDFERKTFQKDRITECLEIPGDPEKLVSTKYTQAAAGGGEPFLNMQAKGLLNFLNGMRVKLKDSRYKFLFEPGCFTPSLGGKVTQDLDALLYSWVGAKKPITILNLSGVPSDLMVAVSGTLLKVIYDALFWGQNTDAGGKKQPLLIVLDEAHNYLKAGEKSIASRTVQTIAKEGRKYGVGLMLVTQRPSELDETVLSQCGTMIALRMNNTKDRGHIQAAIQDELQTMVDLLPSMRTGEALISGEAVKIPTRIKFYRAAYNDKSADPKATIRWQEAKPEQDKYTKAIEYWRKQQFN